MTRLVTAILSHSSALSLSLSHLSLHFRLRFLFSLSLSRKKNSLTPFGCSPIAVATQRQEEEEKEEDEEVVRERAFRAVKGLYPFVRMCVCSSGYVSVTVLWHLSHWANKARIVCLFER